MAGARVFFFNEGTFVIGDRVLAGSKKTRASFDRMIQAFGCRGMAWINGMIAKYCRACHPQKTIVKLDP